MYSTLQTHQTQKGAFTLNSSKVLGQGGQNIVYQGTYQNQQVAIIVPKEKNERTMRQLQIWEKIKHENLLKCYLWHLDPKTQKIYIVVQKCKHNLREQLENFNNYLFEGQVLNYAYQIISGLHYLNQENELKICIMHRDIKPQNILIGQDGKLKICDFGFAKIVDKKNTYKALKHTDLGTMSYVCPQIIKGESYSAKSDVWSTGCVILQLLTGKNQFQSKYKFTMQNKQKDFIKTLQDNLKKLVLEIFIIMHVVTIRIRKTKIHRSQKSIIMENQTGIKSSQGRDQFISSSMEKDKNSLGIDYEARNQRCHIFNKQILQVYYQIFANGSCSK